MEEGSASKARLFDLALGEEGLASALQLFLQNADALMDARKASLGMSARFDLKHSLDEYERVISQASKIGN
jgi:hypothetical protein